jgi:hypothetical protein
MRLFTTVLVVTLLTGCAGNGANSDIDDSLITLPKDSKSPMNPTSTNHTDESKAQEQQPVKAEDEGESGLDDTASEEPLKAEDESESGLDDTASEEPLKAEDESESGLDDTASEEPLKAEDESESGLDDTASEEPLKAEDESESGLDDTASEEPVKAEDEGEPGFVTTKSDIEDILSDNAKEGALYHSSTIGPGESPLLHEVVNEPVLELETQSGETFNIYIPED